jgi:hypothetical protein
MDDIPTTYPDGKYACECVAGSCTVGDPIEDIDSDNEPRVAGGRRFVGHWERQPDNSLRFIIDKTWLEE